MRRSGQTIRGFFACTLGLLLLAGCEDLGVSPVQVFPQTEPEIEPDATLFECPAAETRFASASLGTGGGVLALDGHRLIIPHGALAGPAEITLTAPASPFLEIEVRVNGQDTFLFQRTVLVAISYVRCARAPGIDRLRVFRVDASTGALGEEFDAIDDMEFATLSVLTDRLTRLVVAH